MFEVVAQLAISTSTTVLFSNTWQKEQWVVDQGGVYSSEFENLFFCFLQLLSLPRQKMLGHCPWPSVGRRGTHCKRGDPPPHTHNHKLFNQIYTHAVLCPFSSYGGGPLVMKLEVCQACEVHLMSSHNTPKMGINQNTMAPKKPFIFTLYDWLICNICQVM